MNDVSKTSIEFQCVRCHSKIIVTIPYLNLKTNFEDAQCMVCKDVGTLRRKSSKHSIPKI